MALGIAPSLVQSSPKRNTAIAPPPGDPPAIPDSKCDLFDCHREPPDQPRNLFQMVGIGMRDRARKPIEALIVAHRGDIAGNNRRRCPDGIGLEVSHLITSRESGIPRVAGE
jgi:hypothetical protein